MEVEMLCRQEKRCKRGSGGSVHLPDEIMEEVLLHLPARSVFRFRAVCRAWSALLRSTGFTDAYAAKEDARRMVTPKFVFFAPPAVYSCTQRDADKLFTVDGLSTNFLCLSSRPCHGLLLFSDTRSATYWVCNASTGECRRLPPPQEQPRRRLCLSSAGLVFDLQNDECKVVHLLHEGGTNLRCVVYTLSSTQNHRGWRPATGSIPLRLGRPAIKAMEVQDTVTKVPPVFVDGHLHWLLYPNSYVIPGPDRAAALCFSVADETFSLVDAPASEQVEEYRRLEEHFPAVPIHLAELGGSLCMVHDLRRPGGSCLDIWVLKDREASQWSLDHRIAVTLVLARDVHSPRFITVLGYCSARTQSSGDKKKIMLATSEHKVHFYDLETEDVHAVLSFPETIIGPRREAAAALHIGLYEDNLVRVGSETESCQEKQVSSALSKVFLRLPMKSIVQSMLVCRQWCKLIESDSFARSHMSTNMTKAIFMVTNGSTRHDFFGFEPVECWLQRSAPLTNSLIDDRIICSKPCYGLNLISNRRDDYLCNPCTGSIRCLGTYGKQHQICENNDKQAGNNHNFTIGRNIGLGFDLSTGEHVVVEICYFYGSLACMVKESSRDVWSYAGKPPAPVTDMPPAHINGTLYWLAKPQLLQERVVVAFDVSARTFVSIPCHPCRDDDHVAFLVELDGTLSLVLANAEAEELDIWMAHERGIWINAFKICLSKQPNYSLKTEVVVPLEINRKHGKILLNTGRTLGYYDTKTKAIHTLYSLDQSQLPGSSLVFPMLCEDSLVGIQDDELLDSSAPHVEHDRCGCTEQPVCNIANEGVVTTFNERNKSPRSILQECENSWCHSIANIYRRCCRRVFCCVCADQCFKHSREDHLCLPTRWFDVAKAVEYLGVPLDHPFVPGPEYCYYYSTRNADMAGHVFVSIKDYERTKQPRQLIECGYRMEGQVVRETWVRRYLADDAGVDSQIW